jgi:sulfur relay (sulfurtransferase) complex TusBCD TusD component (DsrE family)
MSQRSLFLALIGAPYESDLFTTTVRLADEAVRQRNRVTVWTCGYATALTVLAIGEEKPRNVQTWDLSYPSPSALVTHLLRWADGSLQWLVCRYCAEERGAMAQLAEVRIRPPYEFLSRADAADVSLVLGVK